VPFGEFGNGVDICQIKDNKTSNLPGFNRYQEFVSNSIIGRNVFCTIGKEGEPL
jgi:hypothetical protein